VPPLYIDSKHYVWDTAGAEQPSTVLHYFAEVNPIYSTDVVTKTQNL